MKAKERKDDYFFSLKTSDKGKWNLLGNCIGMIKSFLLHSLFFLAVWWLLCVGVSLTVISVSFLVEKMIIIWAGASIYWFGI